MCPKRAATATATAAAAAAAAAAEGRKDACIPKRHSACCDRHSLAVGVLEVARGTLPADGNKVWVVRGGAHDPAGEEAMTPGLLEP